MWETLETAFYILLMLLFLTTFMPKRVQRNVADSTYHLWLFLGELVRWLEPRAYALVTGQDPARRQGRPSLFGGMSHAPVESEIPLPAAENAVLHRGEPPAERAEIAPATADEVQALARALRHNLTSADKTKSGAIKAGWGLSRSGTDLRYRRASELYDLATKPAEPFPELGAEKRRVVPKEQAARSLASPPNKP